MHARGEAALAAALAAATAAVLYWAKRKRTSAWLPTCSYAIQRSALLADTRIDQLLIITDFDATLTTGDSEQCHDLIGFSKRMSEPFRKVPSRPSRTPSERA
jgi:5'-nucleotidase